MRLPKRLSEGIDELRSVAPASVLGVFVGWVLYSAYVFLHSRALVADEITFVGIAHDNTYRYFLTQPPPGLYGSVFWVVLKAAGSAWVARVAILAMFCATPWLILKTIRPAPYRAAVLLLWLTFPAAWWSGKLISPEIPAMFLVALALYCFDRERYRTTAALLGLATGTKLSAAPVIVYFTLTYLWLVPAPIMMKLRQAPVLAGWFLAGLLVGFPTLLDGLREMAALAPTVTSRPLAVAIREVLLRDRWEWDSVFSGGALRFSVMPVPLALLIIASLSRDWRSCVVFAATACLFLVVVLRSPTQYGWYWFPLLPLLLHQTGRPEQPRRVPPVAMALLVAALINGYQQLPLITDFAYQKHVQIRVLEQRDEIRACLQTKLKALHPRTVLDLSEFGLDLGDVAGTTFFHAPSAEALEADLELRGVRSLVAQTSEAEAPVPAATIRGACGPVLLLSRH